MANVALRYSRFTGRNPVVVSVPRGGVTRLHLPGDEVKVHLVRAVLKAHAESGEELELLGAATAELDVRAREGLRRRVGAVSREVGLISNLNAWENISLPAAYHGAPPLAEVAELAQAVLARLRAEPDAFPARLPDELRALQRRLAGFVRPPVGAAQPAPVDHLAPCPTRT